MVKQTGMKKLVQKKKTVSTGFTKKTGERGKGMSFTVDTYRTITGFKPEVRIKYGPNVKREGSKSHERYERYRKAQTVGEALAFGTKVADLCWELERGIYKVVGTSRTEAQERAAIGSKAYDNAVQLLSKLNGPHGLAFSLTDDRAAEEHAKEEAWRKAKVAHCEKVAKELGLKPETAEEIDAMGIPESRDLRLERRCADEMSARILKESRKITCEDVTKVLDCWGFDQNVGRENVMPEGQRFVYSDTIGALKRRCGVYGITPPTERYPNFVKLLTAWLKDNGPQIKSKFVCTSINLNCNYAAKRHRDQNNEGPSVIRAFGKFKGGKLRYWKKDRKVQGMICPKVESLREEDASVYDIAKATTVFDGNRCHAVDSFTGQRYSIVYFTGKGFGKFTPARVKTLKGLGFPWPEPQTMAALKEETSKMQ